MHKTHYTTISEAINSLTSEGFTVNIFIKDNEIFFNENQVHINDLKIIDIYRYEGNTDPGDEATVYAIESRDGQKGLIVDGYGYSSDNSISEIIKKIKI